MLPELGHFSLIVALCIALVQGIVPMAGFFLRAPRWMALARPAAAGQFGFLLLAFALLTHAFISNDFSVLYVASNSNSALPLAYRISAVWGGHEGSLLLWAVLMGGWAAAVALLSRRLPAETVALVLAVLGLVSVGFLLFMLITSNPFERLALPPTDGRDLNPLLQDPGLILHPPLLYMGYVGFSVAFAFAIAALLQGRLDAAWARWSRPWTTVAWAFLTLGITVGAWWAYYELGWGGWWFWDPVENASLLPWLVGTALVHSLAVSEKRGAFKRWTVLLAILAFSLSLLGTFLVRSGVLTSVHAFATDPARGLFILVLLALVVGASLLVYAWRAPQMHSSARFALLSRETLLLGNNVLLVVAAASVLLGTLYPLLLDALGGGRISVGAPYFNTVFIPLMAPLVFAIGLGIRVRWRRDHLSRLRSAVRCALPASIAAGLLAPWAWQGEPSPAAALGVGLGTWLLLTTALDLRHRLPRRTGPAAARPLSLYGMSLAHLGVGVTVVGITLSSVYGTGRDVRMAPGDSAEVGGYTFTFEGVQQREGPNYSASVGTVLVMRDGAPAGRLHTEERHYRVQQMPMTEAGIDGGLFRDLYVALGERLEDGAWALRVYHKPFVRWIWLGALLMALGGLLAAADRRYRLAPRRGPASGISAPQDAPTTGAVR